MVTKLAIIWVKVHNEKGGLVTEEINNDMASLLKITHRKNEPHLLSFIYKECSVQFFTLHAEEVIQMVSKRFVTK